MNITTVIEPFLTLRERGIRDPFYCRLVLPVSNVVGWLWRNPENAGRNLRSGERFTLSLSGSSDVEIAWRPLFEGVLSGDRHACHYAVWFFDQKPQVAGGTFESLDDYRAPEREWDVVARDFIPVRCGSYLDGGGERRWRQPSCEMIDWIRDPDRFLTSANIRAHVIRAVTTPLPSGERVTIRRIFEGAPCS